MINALTGLVGMFCSMIAVLTLWISGGAGRTSIGAQPWCGRREITGRDAVFLAAVAATVVFSCLWWYQYKLDAAINNCVYAGGPLQMQVCQDAEISFSHRNGWTHARNWLPTAGLLLAALIVLLRIHTRWMRPQLARVLTRLLLVTVDLLAVFSLFVSYDSARLWDRLWPIFATFTTTMIASCVAMRNLPFLLRWLTQ